MGARVRGDLRLHHQIGAANDVSIRTGQADGGESKEDNDRAEPPDRGRDMRGERELGVTCSCVA